MTINQDIATALRRIPGFLGDASFQYRTLTSNAGVEPRTWSSWTAATSLQIDCAKQQIWDADRNQFYVMWTLKMRCPDTVVLNPGDQVQYNQDGQTTYWAFQQRLSCSPGTVRYIFERDLGLLGGGNDNGGGL